MHHQMLSTRADWCVHVRRCRRQASRRGGRSRTVSQRQPVAALLFFPRLFWGLFVVVPSLDHLEIVASVHVVWRLTFA